MINSYVNRFCERARSGNAEAKGGAGSTEHYMCSSLQEGPFMEMEHLYLEKQGGAAET
jgi:hypothetical protein